MSGADYLDHLVDLRSQHGAVFRRGSGQLYVADAAIAKEVLGNSAGNFREQPDFFRVGNRTFGPRSAQVAVGRASKQLLQAHSRDNAHALPELVDQHLAPISAWPDAGNRLIFEYTLRVLIGANPSAALLDTVHAVVERAVLAGARDRYSWWARARFRAQVMRVLSAEIAARRARGGDRPADLLDVCAQAATAHTTNRDLAEVFLSCLFAVVGSVGFLLGWTLYLLGTSSSATEPVPAAWAVREALRLWPVAWLFARRPERPCELAGVTVTPADEVLVCGYLVHRDPGHWTEPDQFRPARWASVSGQEAFIPFGWGPHACTGAAIAMHLVEDLVELITSTYALEITATDSRPHVSAALAPPQFGLRLGQVSGGIEGR